MQKNFVSPSMAKGVKEEAKERRSVLFKGTAQGLDCCLPIHKWELDWSGSIINSLEGDNSSSLTHLMSSFQPLASSTTEETAPLHRTVA